MNEELRCPECGNVLEVQDSPFGYFANAICRACKQSWYGLKEVIVKCFCIKKLMNGENK